MERIAQCVCGELSIKVQGDPKLSIACNCTHCQRRTGSAFGLSAYYDDAFILEQVGKFKMYELKSDSGKSNLTSFCGKCGTTVFWKAEALKGLTGIAVGCFSDPHFPKPTAVAWNRSKHDWVSFPETCYVMNEQEPKRK